uniref:Uncharacterized protein n=1 Tax=Rhodnius prolixus TaxID=13249 RepID=T1HRU9_RHOPR
MALTLFRTKLIILKNNPKLKGTGIKISDYYPKEVLQIRKALLPKLVEAREMGKYGVIKYNKLIIKDKITSNNENNSGQLKKRMLSNSPPTDTAAHNRKMDQAKSSKKTKSATDSSLAKMKLQQFSYTRKSSDE